MATSLRPTATVTLSDEEGSETTGSAVGTGPVDAVCRALNTLAGIPNDLIEFSVKSVTEGIDAMGEVTIRLRRDGSLYSGHAADTDVVVAAAMGIRQCPEPPGGWGGQQSRTHRWMRWFPSRPTL